MKNRRFFRILLIATLQLIINFQFFSEEAKKTETSANKFSTEFQFPLSKNVNIDARTGALKYRKNLLTVPGKNGLDLDISLNYCSSNANDKGTNYWTPNDAWQLSLDRIYQDENNGNDVFYDEFGNHHVIQDYRNSTTKFKDKKVNDLFISAYGNSVRYKDGLTKTFNSDGQLIEKNDRFGNKIVYTYESNRIKNIVDSYGNTFNFIWNIATDKKVALTISYGNRTIEINGDLYNISSVKDAEGRITTYNYTQIIQGEKDLNASETLTPVVLNKNMLAEIKDSDGLVTTVSYTSKLWKESYSSGGNSRIYYKYAAFVDTVYEKDEFTDEKMHEIAKLSYSSINYMNASSDYSVNISYPDRDLYRVYTYSKDHLLTNEKLYKKAYGSSSTDSLIMNKTYNGYFNGEAGYPLNILTEYTTDYNYLTRAFTIENASNGGISKNITSLDNTSSNSVRSSNTIDISTNYGSSARKVDETYAYDAMGNMVLKKIKDYLTGKSFVEAYSGDYAPPMVVSMSNTYAFVPYSIESSDENVEIQEYNPGSMARTMVYVGPPDRLGWNGKELKALNLTTKIKKTENFPSSDRKVIEFKVEYGDESYKRITAYTYYPDGRIKSQTIKESSAYKGDILKKDIAAIMADSSEKVVTNFYYYDNNTDDGGSKKHTVITELIDKGGNSICKRTDYDVFTGNILKSFENKENVPTKIETITKTIENRRQVITGYKTVRILGFKTKKKTPIYGWETYTTTETESVITDSALLRLTKLNSSLISSENKYDLLGRIIESRSLGETLSTKYGYKDNDAVILNSKTFKGNSVTTTLPNGYTTIEIFNGHGKLIAKGEKLKPTDTTYKLLLENSYTVDGELINSSYDSLGHRTNYIYDYLFRNVGVINPDGSSKFTIIDDGKNRLINIDEEGTAVVNDYDEFGKTLKTFEVKNKVLDTQKFVDLKNLQEDAYTVVNKYDSIGNLVSINMGGTERKSFQYDTLGRLLAVKIPSLNYKENLHFFDGSSIKEFRYGIYNSPKSPLFDSVYTKYFYTYDLLGNVIEKSYDKNSSNDFVSSNKKIIDKLSYDYRGNLLTNIYGDKNEYDNLGRLVKKTDSKGQVFTYTYYDNGLVETVNVNGTETEKYTYDVNQQVLTKQAKNKSGNWDVLKYSYKENGLLNSITFNDKVLNSYEYNELNFVKNLVDSKGNKLEYTYDDRNRMKGILQDNKTVLAYSYFKNGAIKSVTQGTDTESYTYNDKGLLQDLSFNNQKIYNYYYDGYNELYKKDDYINKETSFYLYSQENRLIESTTFELGGKNFKLSLGKDANNTDIIVDQTTQPLFKRAMKYKYTDFGDIDKVISYKNSINDFNIGNFKIEAGKVSSVDYGNLIKTSEETYVYSERESVDSAYKGKTVPEILTCYAKINYTDSTATLESNIKYSYDLNGNLQKEDNGGKIKEYGYDSFNKLTSYKDEQGKLAEYSYYPDSMRKSKSYDGKTTTFYYDNGNIIGEEEGNNYTTNIFGPTGIIARKAPNKNIMFFIKGAHGDIIRTVGVDGTPLPNTPPVIPTPTTYPAIVSNTPVIPNFNESVMKTISTYKYEDYGKVIDGKNTADNPFRYSGEYTDDETGFQYLRARYYNPNIRRFITEDTYTGEITNPLSLNLYAYCAGNPIMYVDPSGHFSEETKEKWRNRWEKTKEWWNSNTTNVETRLSNYADYNASLLSPGRYTDGGYIIDKTSFEYQFSYDIFSGGPPLGIVGGKKILTGKGLTNIAGELHHIASDKSIASGFTAKYKKIFEKAGMSLNDSANKIFLENHKGAHTKDYKQYVLRRLNDATEGLSGDAAKKELTRTLNELANELQSNPRMPYKGGMM